MTMMILDGVLILVIGWGVMYAWRTSTAMQTVKNEMKPVTRQLGSYLNIIGQHLQQLRETTESNRRALNEQLPQAKVLREDFEVLLDHGSRLAERLDALLEQAYAVERDLRAANTGIATATSHVGDVFAAGQAQTNQHQTVVTRQTIRHKPYSDVLEQTPIPLNVQQGASHYTGAPSQNVYAPTAVQPPPSPIPVVAPMQQPMHMPAEQLEAARVQAMQTRGEVMSRLRGVRI